MKSQQLSYNIPIECATINEHSLCVCLPLLKVKDVEVSLVHLFVGLVHPLVHKSLDRSLKVKTQITEIFIFRYEIRQL